MIIIQWQHLLYFLPQYVIAILISIFIYRKLSKKAPANTMDIDVFKKFQNYIETQKNLDTDLYSLSKKLSTTSLVENPFSRFTAFVYNKNVEYGYLQTLSNSIKTLQLQEPALYRFTDTVQSQSGVYEDLYTLSDKVSTVTFREQVFPKFAEYLSTKKEAVEYNQNFAQKLRSKLDEIEENINSFYILTTVLTVVIWSGVILLLTPFPEVLIFTPHFGMVMNSILLGLLGLSIYISVIALVSFFLNIDKNWLLKIEGIVTGGVTAAMFSPALSWSWALPVPIHISLYILILSVFAGITYFVMTRKHPQRLYSLSFYSSYVAFGIFNFILTYNLIVFILAHLRS